DSSASSRTRWTGRSSGSPTTSRSSWLPRHSRPATTPAFPPYHISRPRPEDSREVWMGLLALTLSMTLLGQPRPDVDVRLAEYLGRLGLVELRALHLEDRLSRDKGVAKADQVALARSLADLYADQLLNGAAREDEGAASRLNRKIDDLLAR